MKHLIVCVCAALLVGCTPNDAEQKAETRPAAREEAAPAAARPVQPPASETVPPAAAVSDVAQAPTVRMTTSMGDIVIELNSEKAPLSVENFLAYARAGFYDGTIFHRVIPNFMIQGGGFLPDMQQKPTQPPVRNEAANGLKNLRGTIAMARTSVPDSATSQFFINHRDNPALDYRGPQPQLIGYAVFGRVVSGMEVVDKIAAVQTRQAGPYGDVPVTPVIIESVRIINP